MSDIFEYSEYAPISEKAWNSLSVPHELVPDPTDAEISERLLLVSRQILQWVTPRDPFFKEFSYSRGNPFFSPEFFSRFYASPSEAVLPEKEFVRVMVHRIRDCMSLLKTVLTENTGGSFDSHGVLHVRVFRKSPKNGDWYSEISVNAGNAVRRPWGVSPKNIEERGKQYEKLLTKKPL